MHLFLRHEKRLVWTSSSIWNCVPTWPPLTKTAISNIYWFVAPQPDMEKSAQLSLTGRPPGLFNQPKTNSGKFVTHSLTRGL